MGRLIVIAVLASLLVRGLTGQWPWQLWANSERSQDEARARALLGVDRAARREDVLDAHRRLLTVVHPDRGGSNEQVHEANRARDLLLARIERQESK